MSYEQAAQGILKRAAHDDCEFFIVACKCGCRDADHNVTVEGNSKFDLVEVVISTTQRWFGIKERVRAAWRILTRGYVDYETSIVLNGQQAANYAGALMDASDRIADYKKQQQDSYELDDSALTEEEHAAIRAASTAANLPPEAATRTLYDLDLHTSKID